MTTGAWIMLVAGIVILWGGTAYFLSIAFRGKGFK
jgi:hypothetical protein